MSTENKATVGGGYGVWRGSFCQTLPPDDTTRGSCACTVPVPDQEWKHFPMVGWEVEI